MNTQAFASNPVRGAQLALFLPTAENFSSVRALMDSPHRKKSEKQASPTAGTANGWRPVTLDDMTPDEVASAPSTFQELCRVTSVKEAIAMCEQLGGLKLRIPPPEDGKRWRNSEWRKKFKAMLTPESYESLLRELGRSGSDFTFPSLNKLKKQRRDQCIRNVVDSLIAQKKPYFKTLQTIARAEGLHMVTIYKILKRSN